MVIYGIYIVNNQRKLISIFTLHNINILGT